MAEIVVEVPEVDGDQAAAVAAGAALATAEQAAEVAGEAEVVAGEAVDTANLAVDTAAAAAGSAYDAQTDVAELRAEFSTFLDEWRLRQAAPAPVEVVEETAPAPAPKPKAKPKQVDDGDQGDAKPAVVERGYGSKRWFGGR